MLVITALAILCVPLTAALTAYFMVRFHQTTLQHIEATATVGGKPVSLIAEELRVQAEATAQAAEDQRRAIESLRERKLTALGG